MNTYFKEIVQVLDSIGLHFKKNELTYLGITGKLEIPFRDKLAFLLHEKLEGKAIVCREWWDKSGIKTRADIAIVDLEGELKCLVEIKAYSAMMGIEKFASKMSSDIEKSKIVIGKREVENIFIMFANNLSQIPVDPIVENDALKYRTKLQRAFKNNVKDQLLIEQWNEAVAHIQRKDEHFYNIKGGVAFGTELNIYSFLYLV